MSGKVKADILFLGLTRPTFILGVTTHYFVVNVFLALFLYILFHTFYIILGSLIVHGIGYIICKIDPFYLNIISNYIIKVKLIHIDYYKYKGKSYSL